MTRLSSKIAHSGTKARAKPLISGGQKAAHYEQLVFDADLSPFDVRVGIAIGSHIDRFRTGRARVGRETIAGKIGASVRAVEKSIRKLEGMGHFEVYRRAVGVAGGRVIHGGRGGCNEYEPVWKRASGDSPRPNAETANEDSRFESIRANVNAQMSEQTGSNERTAIRTNPEFPRNLSPIDAVGPRPLPRAVAEVFPEIGRKYRAQVEELQEPEQKQGGSNDKS